MKEIAEEGAQLAEKGVTELHHLLPQANEFKDFFKQAGLNIEDFKITLNKAAHRLKPNGIHTGPANWNKIWRDFKQSNPHASKEQILKQLEKMKKDFGIQ